MALEGQGMSVNEGGPESKREGRLAVMKQQVEKAAREKSEKTMRRQASLKRGAILKERLLATKRVKVLENKSKQLRREIATQQNPWMFTQAQPRVVFRPAEHTEASRKRLQECQVERDKELDQLEVDISQARKRLEEADAALELFQVENKPSDSETTPVARAVNPESSSSVATIIQEVGATILASTSDPP